MRFTFGHIPVKEELVARPGASLRRQSCRGGSESGDIAVGRGGVTLGAVLLSRVRQHGRNSAIIRRQRVEGVAMNHRLLLRWCASAALTRCGGRPAWALLFDPMERAYYLNVLSLAPKGEGEAR